MKVMWVAMAGLALAPAAVAAADSAAVPAAVDVRNDMGKRYRLVEAILTVDDKQVADRTAASGQELERTFRLWGDDQPRLKPGQHALTATLVFEGRNVGPFNYLRDYRFRVESTFPFTVSDGGGPADIEVVAQERGGPNVPLEKRPVLSVQPEPGSSATPQVTGPGPTIVPPHAP